MTTTTAERERLRSAAFVAAFTDEWTPTPEQRAELAPLILAAIAEVSAAVDGDVVPWARVRRRLPAHLRPYDADVLTQMWLDGRVWLCSVKGQWQVAKGDAADRARVDRDRHHGSATAPLAI
ncbi:hypothetical protein [[Mycobacterium] crassicus]|uniref:Uncharacterized protein n=1 Tax=[Mycobacterium] crassicus TaxID=2872309 RepID=A0ABU5XFY2_9MYCO|nr:hypothetical protein [Mycolicibacter sp. MYC098]MEB3020894.1 hypothetical protein [Mycolicibacter sp. MYC098]